MLVSFNTPRNTPLTFYKGLCMSDKVVSLVADTERKTRQEVIDVLQNMLALAREDEIAGIAVAAVYEDGCSANAFCAGKPLALMGELEILKREIIDHQIDLRLHESGTEY